MKRFLYASCAACVLAMSGCESVQSSGQRVLIIDGNPKSKLYPGQNAIIHYTLEDDSRAYKYCKIVSVDDYWLTVADKVVKNAESDELSGWNSMIPIKNILMIRVETDSH